MSITIDISKLEEKTQQMVRAQKKQAGSHISSFLSKDIKIFSRKFSDKQKEKFYSELYILLSAGVDLKSALELIEKQQTKEADKKIIGQVKDSVVTGSGFSEALESTGNFSTYEFVSIKIGEESGKLLSVLQQLATFFAGRLKQKRQLVSALSYPAIILMTAFGAIFFMMNFVVPMFADVFKRFNADLPWITEMVVHLSTIFSKYVLVLLLIVGALFVFLYSRRQQPWMRRITSLIILRIPIIGKTIRKIYLARFCHSMNLLISSRTQMITAIELVKRMISFYPIEITLEEVKEDLMHGVHLNESLAKSSIYDRRMISLLKVGEEVNQLDKIFEKLSDQYTAEADYETKIFGSLIEPILIIFLGLFVGTILVAMYLPIFKLGVNIH